MFHLDDVHQSSDATAKSDDVKTRPNKLAEGFIEEFCILDVLTIERSEFRYEELCPTQCS